MFSRSARPLVLLVALGMLATTAPVQALTPALPATSPAASPTAKKKQKIKVKRARGIIVAPKRDAKIRVHDMRIRVRAKDGIVRAKLNKVGLTRFDFTWRKGAYYTLDASSSHGLKHKANTLTVVVRDGKAGLKKQRVRFVVKHSKPLTGAGRNVTVEAGSSVVVDGRLRLPRGKRAGKALAAPSTSMTWAVVKAPGRDPQLQETSPTDVQLDTVQPGRYVLRATGSDGSVKTNDTVTIDAAPSPMMAFDSYASSGGVPGIRIGETVYAANGPLDKAQWQVLIVDRHTGAVKPGYNYTYGVCPDNAQAICRWNSGGRVNQAPQDGLEQNLSSSTMAIAVHHQGFGGGFGNAATYFAGIGAPKNLNPTGPTALIGLQAWEPGQAMRAVNSQRGLKGSLQWDRYKNFVFISGDRTQFDTRAGGGCGPDTCTVTMTVGGVPRTYSLPASGAGFAVQAINRTTLEFISGQAFNLNGDPGTVTAQIEAMLSYLKQLPDGAMVMVASLGNPANPLMGVPGMQSKYTRSCWLSGLICTDDLDIRGSRVAGELADTIADLGGTRHAFLQSTRTAGDNYSLVGWSGLEQATGSEVRSKGARISGAFVRGTDSRFRTANVTEDGQADDRLMTLVSTPPKSVPWPGAGDAVYQRFLDDIGTKVRIGADPRSAYWTRDVALQNGNPQYWIDRSDQAKALTVPAGLTNAEQQVWLQVQKDFVQELIWVGSVRQYFAWLQNPYQAGNQLSAWIKGTNVVSTLKTSDDWAKNQSVGIDWMAIFATLIEMVAPFGGLVEKAEKAIHIIAGLAAAALEYAAMGTANTENGDRVTEDDEEQVKALEAETEVVDRMQQAAETYQRMADVIVSDYSKLKEFGTLTACNAEGRPCESGFETMTDDTFDRASVSAQRGAERTVFKELLPIAWPVVKIPTGGKLSGDGYPEGNWSARRYECYSASLFTQIPDRANIFRMTDTKYKLSDYGDYKPFLLPKFQVYVIAEFGKNNARNNVITPSDTKAGDKAILGRMFKPLSDSFDVSDGGLGINPAEYMAEVENENLTKDYDLTCGGWDYSDNNTPAPVN